MNRQAHYPQQQPQQMRHRVRRQVANRPTMQPQQRMNNSDTAFAGRMIKFVVMLFLAYIIIPTKWLLALQGALQ